MSLGFEQAGVDVVVALEHDEIDAAAHRFNFPKTEVIVEDARRVTVADLRAAIKRGLVTFGRAGEWDGTVDVVFGGPPCQGFSFGGKRKPNDERNALVFEFLRIVTELQPRYFMMENVPGLLADDHAHTIEKLLAGFNAAGYEVGDGATLVNAADYGVPQDRRRVILLGWRRGESSVRVPSPTVRHVERGVSLLDAIDDEYKGACGPSVWDAIGDLPDPDDFPELLLADIVQLKPAILERCGSKQSEYVRMLNGGDPRDLSYPRSWDGTFITASTRTGHSAAAVRRFAATAAGEMEQISRFRRLSRNGLSRTLRAGTGPEHGSHTPPRPIHPTSPRVITVREAARLHSFPDWFRFHAAKWHAWRQVGNSVPPLLARSIARQLVAALGHLPARPKSAIALGSPNLLGYIDYLGDGQFVPPNSAKSRPRDLALPTANKRKTKTRRGERAETASSH